MDGCLWASATTLPACQPRAAPLEVLAELLSLLLASRRRPPAGLLVVGAQEMFVELRGSYSLCRVWIIYQPWASGRGAGMEIKEERQVLMSFLASLESLSESLLLHSPGAGRGWGEEVGEGRK